MATGPSSRRQLLQLVPRRLIFVTLKMVFLNTREDATLNILFGENEGFIIFVTITADIHCEHERRHG